MQIQVGKEVATYPMFDVLESWKVCFRTSFKMCYKYFVIKVIRACSFVLRAFEKV